MVELLRFYAIRLHIDFTNSVSYPFNYISNIVRVDFGAEELMHCNC